MKGGAGEQCEEKGGEKLRVIGVRAMGTQFGFCDCLLSGVEDAAFAFLYAVTVVVSAMALAATLGSCAYSHFHLVSIRTLKMV